MKCKECGKEVRTYRVKRDGATNEVSSLKTDPCDCESIDLFEAYKQKRERDLMREDRPSWIDSYTGYPYNDNNNRKRF